MNSNPLSVAKGSWSSYFQMSFVSMSFFCLVNEVFPSNLTLLVFLINSDPGFQGPKYSTAVK